MKRRIIFVDDEERVLEGLRNQLRKQRRKWAMRFVSSGRACLEELAREPADVVVTDMRMPGMDGAELLRRVKEEHENAVRVVLSGYAELEMTMRAVMVAHQYLIKPCKPDVIERVIEGSCALQDLINNERIKEVVAKIDKLPAVPRAYSMLTERLSDPNATADDVASIIAEDLGMTAKVLQLVNSSFFAAAMPVNDIKFAVVRLGFDIIKNVVLGLGALDRAFGTQDPEEREQMQLHATRVGHLARQLVSSKAHRADAFLAGMLHDVGQLVLSTSLSEQFQEARTLAKDKEIALCLAEETCIGVSHAEVGAYLLGIWGLPHTVVEAVAHHHAPSKVSDSGALDVVGAVHIANAIATFERRGSLPLGTLDEEYLERVVDAGSTIEALAEKFAA